MDEDSESKKKKKNSIPVLNISNILQPIRVRYPFRDYNEMDEFLLAYSSNFLFFSRDKKLKSDDEVE